ncbi:MAG: dockerin type I repeat-containing protein [Bacteroidota bacterium]
MIRRNCFSLGFVMILLQFTGINSNLYSQKFFGGVGDGYSAASVITPVKGGEITGQVSYDNVPQSPINSVTVYLKLNNVVVAQTTTNNNGDFDLSVPENGTYSLSASCTLPWGGVNSADALRTAQHFTGVITLQGLKLRAADVNNSNYINATDALLIQRRFVGISNSFIAGDWFFETIPLIIGGGQAVTTNLKGICFGDVNGSYIP